MIQIIGGELLLGGQIIVSDIQWRIGIGQRVGLVGANGSGKTSLLRTLIGETSLDKGAVEQSKNLRVGYLPQDGAELPRQTVGETLWGAFDSLNAMEREMKALIKTVEGTEQNSLQHEKALRRYGELQDAFEKGGGYQREAEAKKVLTGLGFADTDWNRPVAEFSGGWRMRVLLGKLLLQRPDILLLDEPTNHLDPQTLHWLELYLQSLPSGLVIVSHDRYFLDRVATEIVEIERKRLFAYKGNYSQYRKLKEERREQLLAQKRAQDKEIAHLERFVERFRAKATKAAQAQSRVKQLEKIERIEVEDEEVRRITIPMPETPRGGKEALKLEGVGHCYGTTRALHPVNATIYRSDRIAVWGANGAGKTTLLSIMAKVFEPSEGRVEWGYNTLPAFFSQQHAELQESPLSVIDELSTVAPPEMQARLRDMLGAFLFRGDDVFKPVSVLSGGEKSRLALAKLLTRPCNLLILDEPLNHLDIATVERLEAALRDFTGTMVFVSHDRFFANRLANQVWELESGRLRVYNGDFNDYEYAKSLEEQQLASNQLEASDLDGNGSSTNSREARKELKRREAEERNRLAAIRREKEKQYRGVEEEIHEVEGEIEELEARLGSMDLARSPAEMARVTKRYKKLRERKEDLYAHWEALVETLED